MATQTRIEDLGASKADKADDKADKPKSSKRAPTPSASAKAEKELRERLAECFDRIAESLANRGDDELAQIIQEDAEIMSAGLVNLTRPFKVLRMPLLAIVAVIEPMLAFGRIVRVLVGRFADRRAYAQERAQQEAYNVAPTE